MTRCCIEKTNSMRKKIFRTVLGENSKYTYNGVKVARYLGLNNFFYNLARLRKRLGIKVNIEMAFLVDEFFKQRNKTLTISFGKPIPYQTFDRRFNDAQWAEKLRTFSYQLGNDCNLVFDPSMEYKI